MAPGAGGRSARIAPRARIRLHRGRDRRTGRQHRAPAQENAARAADTRSNGALINAVAQLLQRRPGADHAAKRARTVRRIRAARSRPTACSPRSRRDARPARRSADPLPGPHRAGGRRRGAARGMERGDGRSRLEPRPTAASAGAFAYTDFGTPGHGRRRHGRAALGIREVRFANGVRLNLKHTELENDRDPLRAQRRRRRHARHPRRPAGDGDGRRRCRPAGSASTRRTSCRPILAGRIRFRPTWRRRRHVRHAAHDHAARSRTAADLLAAALTDPGYRREGEAQYRRNIANFLRASDATPGGALGNAHRRDPVGRRPALHAPAGGRLPRADLRQACAEHWPTGWPTARSSWRWSATSTRARRSRSSRRTLGALPAREPDFLPREDAANAPVHRRPRRRTVTSHRRGRPGAARS